MSGDYGRPGYSQAFRYEHEVGLECVYCGERAQTRDHVPPLRFASAEVPLPRGARYVLVGACRECNSLLGARPLFTITARRAFLVERYNKRYGKVLKCPEWTMDEIVELGRGLQTAVMVQEGERRRLTRRLRHLKGHG